MKKDKDTERIDGKIWNTFVTIICLLVFAAYKLITGHVGLINRLMKNGIIRVTIVIFFGVIAIMFWPLTLTIIATAVIAIIFLTGFEIFFW